MKEDYLYISNDPAENADNFDPKWASFREMTTDKERYTAVRKRWGNPDIPDPEINLSYRHLGNQTAVDSRENNFIQPKNPPANCPPHSCVGRGRSRSASKRRSRSCTRPYEQLISTIHKNYEQECLWLMYKQSLELQKIQQLQSLQTYLYNAHYNNFVLQEILQVHQKQEVMHLLSSHFEEVQNVIIKRKENITACSRFMKEVTGFFAFYKTPSSDEVTFQMTDSQHEHSVETEKMYGLYEKFYKQPDSQKNEKQS